ncbi:MAG: HlyD family efflux transporter periplasmic adaptor subunit [Cyanobacteria bacterium P01_G01_bin.54]
MNRPWWGVLPLNRWTIGLAVVAVAALGVSAVVSTRSLQSEVETTAIETETIEPAEIETISALGRIEPQGEVVSISAPPALGGAKVEELLVQEGQQVRANQVIARLDNYARLQTTVLRAQRDVEVAQADLNIVRAGAQRGEIEAARQLIERLKAQRDGDARTDQDRIAGLDAELRNAQVEHERYQQLCRGENLGGTVSGDRPNLDESLADVPSSNCPEGAISKSELDQRLLTLETAQKRLDEARSAADRRQTTLDRQIREAEAELNRISEIRPVNVQRAQARVRQAEAALKQAEADLTLAVVRSPFTGQVLTINTQPGELVSEDDGIADIGRTDRMIVIAEIYESDISRVKPNQSAVIISENNTFEGELRGTVTNVGLQIGKKDVLDTDPAADVDVRVVEVDIELNPTDSKRVANLTNAKVLVELLL